MTIKSAINAPFEVNIACATDGDLEELEEKLESYEDFTLSINGSYGNPKFELELQSYDIEILPGSAIKTVELVFTDRYAKFRKLERKGAFYYHNLNGIWQVFNKGFKDRLNRKISEHSYLDADDSDKYPTHPIYMQYDETHWNFIIRAFLEHGVNYNFFVSKDGFDLVMYNTNDDISNFIQNDDSSVFSELYNYNINLDRNIKGNNDVVLEHTPSPAGNGCYSNKKIEQINDLYESKVDGHLQISDKPRFIKNVNYIHHNPYTPEEYLISSAVLETRLKKMSLTDDFKSKFNTLTQSQLDEHLNTELNAIYSGKAEQLTAHINGVFLLAGAKLNIEGTKWLKADEHLVTASFVKLVASKSTDEVIGANPKKDYTVTTTIISQDAKVDYHEKAPEHNKIVGLTGVFPYISEYSANHDGVDPDEIGNVRINLPLDYEVCPNNEKDVRYYVPRMSDYGDKTSSHGVPLYKESELHVMFIDGNPNKPIIHGALAHGGTSDLNMKEHHNRHVVEHGQGSAMGYTSDVNSTNSMYLKSEHKGEVSWLSQSNHGMLDQLIATTANRSEVSTGEYQSFHGFDEDTNFSANHHKSIKPKLAVEDAKKITTEQLAEIAPVQGGTYKTSQLSPEELKKLQDEIAEDEKKEQEKECCPPLTELPDEDAAILCELVYEEPFLRAVGSGKDDSLAGLLYDENKVKEALSDYISDVSIKNYNEYVGYYYQVLEKYKVVAISPSSSDGYFSIAVAKECDSKNKGIYIITRGSYNTPNYLSDLKMYVKSLPSIFDESISFVKSVLSSNDEIEYLGFSGHSLGGSVSQAQAVYFEAEKNKNYSISKCINFEPFGIANILAGMKVGETTKEANNFTGVIYVTPNAELSLRYKGSPKAYNGLISNYYRVGDLVSEQELEAILGNVTKIETNYTKSASYFTGAGDSDIEPIDVFTIDPQEAVQARAMDELGRAVGGVEQIIADKLYNLHTMTNYKFQGFNPSLEISSLNTSNVATLVEHGTAKEKARYNLVFKAMQGYKAV